MRYRYEHPFCDENSTFHLQAHSTLQLYAPEKKVSHIPALLIIAVLLSNGRMQNTGDKSSAYGMIARTASATGILSLSLFQLYDLKLSGIVGS